MSTLIAKKSRFEINKIKPTTNVLFNLLFATIALLSVIPLLFVISVSLTDEQVLRKAGYSLFPAKFSIESYRFLMREFGMISRAFGVSVIVTALGTFLGVSLVLTTGYVLSRRSYRLRSALSWFIFIPMIFNGGMVSSYVVISNILQLRDTIWVLILPLCVSSFNIIIARTFFQSTIPAGIVESAQIDGASQLKIFLSVVLPISKPLIATIALFLAFGYWNDWFQASLYINKDSLVGLQALLMRIQKNIEYMARNPELGVNVAQYVRNMPKEGARMAIVVLAVVPIACTYPFFQKYFISGLTIGAVKG